MPNDINDLAQQNKVERDKLLHSIFTRQAKAIDNLLASTPVEELKASMIQSITQFLRLSDVSAETIADEDEDDRETRELGDLVRSLDADSAALAKEDAEAGGTLKSQSPAKGSGLSDPFHRN